MSENESHLDRDEWIKVFKRALKNLFKIIIHPRETIIPKEHWDLTTLKERLLYWFYIINFGVLYFVSLIFLTYILNPYPNHTPYFPNFSYIFLLLVLFAFLLLVGAIPLVCYFNRLVSKLEKRFKNKEV